MALGRLPEPRFVRHVKLNEKSRICPENKCGFFWQPTARQLPCDSIINFVLDAILSLRPKVNSDLPSSAAKNLITGGIDFNRLCGWIELKNRLAQTSRFFWRRRWDSNPRAGSSPTKRFRVVLVATTSILLHGGEPCLHGSNAVHFIITLTEGLGKRFGVFFCFFSVRA